MIMTENEAIKSLELCKESRIFIPNNIVLDMAIQALAEIQQYRAIGTVEDVQEIFSLCKTLQEIVKKYSAIGTIEEFKALKEKSVAKKPNQVSRVMDKDKFAGLIGRCPNCGSIVAEDNFVCEDCFQVLDWQ